jgi:hypothetical protein
MPNGQRVGVRSGAWSLGVTRYDYFAPCTAAVFPIDLVDDEGSIIRDGTLHPGQLFNIHDTCTYLQYDSCVT